MADACPSLANVKSFHGTASASFDQTATFSDQSGTTTVTLDRVADGLQFPNLTPQSLGNGIVTFTGPPGGGSVSVNDVYNSSNGVSGGQTANGPTLGYPDPGNGGVSFYPTQLGCQYGVIFSFAIHTSPSGDWPSPPDVGTYGLIATPERPIPTNLKLSGTATVGWNANPSAPHGFYEATGGPPRTDTWATEYGGLLQESGMAPGTATISWNFSPGTRATSCSVPGATIASAAPDPLAHAAQQTCQQEKKKYSKEMKAFYKMAARAATAVAILYGFVGSVASLIPGGQIDAGFAYGFAFGMTAAAFYASGVADDPRDPNWRSIAKARPIGRLTLPGSGFLGAAGVPTLDGILRQIATVNGLELAFSVSYNRMTSANSAHSSLWVKRQAAAMGRFASQAADAINRLITLIRGSRSSLSAPFPWLTPANITQAIHFVRAHGLPKSLVRLADRFGLSRSLLAAVEQRLKSGAPLPSYATSVYGLLSYAPFITAEQKAANALQTYGQLLLATG
jgi:hypothetical protein